MKHSQEPIAKRQAASAVRSWAALVVALVSLATVTLGADEAGVRVQFDYTYTPDQPAGEIVFNVRCLKTDGPAAPSLAWPIVAVSTSNSAWLARNAATPCVWFAVTASNTVTGQESDWASR
jgi:hypothetical protein